MKWTDYYKKVFGWRYWSNEPFYKQKVVRIVSENDKKEEEKMKLSDFIKKYGDCEVTEEMEKCIKKKKGKWMPKFGEIYYFVNDSDYVASSNWGDTLTDKYRRNFIGIFKTDDEAYRYREIMKACKEASFEPDWEDAKQYKYVIVYDDGVLRVSYRYACNCGEPFYFESYEIAHGLIDRFGEKDIAKYVLGVEVEE